MCVGWDSHAVHDRCTILQARDNYWLAVVSSGSCVVCLTPKPFAAGQQNYPKAANPAAQLQVGWGSGAHAQHLGDCLATHRATASAANHIACTFPATRPASSCPLPRPCIPSPLRAPSTHLEPWAVAVPGGEALRVLRPHACCCAVGPAEHNGARYLPR
jgi:hypothetical protein